jgi:hypothetical protein
VQTLPLSWGVAQGVQTRHLQRETIPKPELQNPQQVASWPHLT